MVKKIAVITVTYKFPPKKLKKFIENISVARIKDHDIYIKDNTTDNIGYGKAINSILRENLTKYDAFFIVNPDIIIEKDCVEKLVETLFSSETIGIVGPKVLYPSGEILSLGGIIDKKRYSGGLLGIGQKDTKRQEETEVDFVSGGSMLIRREVFNTIGLFDDAYFLYYEDVNFCVRAKRKGFQIITNPKAVITHFVSTSVGKNSPAMVYYMARNRLYFLEKFAPIQIKIREISRLPKTLFQARKNPYELLGIRDYFLRKSGKNDFVKAGVDTI